MRATGSQDVTLPSIDLSQVAGPNRKPPSLLDYQKTVGSKFRVQISSKQNRTTGATTFTIKSDSDKDIVKARRHLIATLSPMVTVKVEAPNSTLPAIIGPQGSTIKAIRDKTNARIDVPRRDDIPGNGTPAGLDDDEDEPTTTITISAPQPLAHEARALVEDIIRSRKAKATQRVRNVPAHILPFINVRRAEFLRLGEELGEVVITIDKGTNTIVVTGDRDAVKAVTESVSSNVESLKTNLTPLKMGLPKKQHRLLTPAAISDILAKTHCVVTTPAPEDPSDEIQVWGNISQGANISSGLQAVLAVSPYVSGSEAKMLIIFAFPLESQFSAHPRIPASL